MSRAIDAVLSRPWAVLPEMLETIAEMAQRQGDISAAIERRESRAQALDSRPGEAMDGTRAVRIRDGVAVVSAIGPIMRYANLMSEVSGAQSLQSLSEDFRAAVESPAVHSILLEIDGPGGEASGINEFSKQVFDARAIKPVVAYVSGMAASAHYWIASSASKIIVDAAAEIGSIGVVFGYTDYSEADRKAGKQRIEVVSSRAPMKRANPLEDAGRQEIQGRANAIEEVFIQSVARNRGVSTSVVERDFGRGGILVGQAAVNAGLADRLGDFESVIIELANVAGATKRGFFAMSDIQPTTTAAVAAEVPPAIEQETIQAAASVPQPNPHAIAAEAVAGERARIVAIMDAAPAGYQAEARRAILGGATAEQFALSVLNLAKQRGVSLADIAADATSAPPSSPPSAESSSRSVWDSAISATGGKR